MSETLQAELETNTKTFLREVIEGLRETPKRLPCKYFYDKRGSALFDQICDLDEYYLTRAEQEIMSRFAHEMGSRIGAEAMLVEYGSGSSVKTKTLLDNLEAPTAYVPIDISHRHLHQVAEGLREEFPHIEILPVTADFTGDFELPLPKEAVRSTSVYFPGSTIGNFEESEAEHLLRSIAIHCGNGGGLLIGIDLVKEVDVLERAYDDSLGITAEFNLNLIHRIRNELCADIDPSQFEHHAFFNDHASRIEIYLRSLKDQTVVIDGKSIEFAEGELVHTEHSHKYTINRFSQLAARAGFQMDQAWTDDEELFAVLHLNVVNDSR